MCGRIGLGLALSISFTLALGSPAARAGGKLTEVQLNGFNDFQGLAGWAVVKPKSSVALGWDRLGQGSTDRRMQVRLVTLNPAGVMAVRSALAGRDRWPETAALAWEGDPATGLDTPPRATRKGLVLLVDSDATDDSFGLKEAVLRAAVLRKSGKVARFKPVLAFEATELASISRWGRNARTQIRAAAHDGVTGVALGYRHEARGELRLLELNGRGKLIGAPVVLELPGGGEGEVYQPLAIGAAADGWIVVARNLGLFAAVEPLLVAWQVPYGASRDGVQAVAAASVAPATLDAPRVPAQAERLAFEGASVGRFLSTGAEVLFQRETTWDDDYAKSRKLPLQDYELLVAPAPNGRAVGDARSIALERWDEISRLFGGRSDRLVQHHQAAALGTSEGGDVELFVARTGWYNVFGRSWQSPIQEYSVYRLRADGGTEPLFSEQLRRLSLHAEQVELRRFGKANAALFFMRSDPSLYSALYLLSYAE